MTKMHQTSIIPSQFTEKRPSRYILTQCESLSLRPSGALLSSCARRPSLYILTQGKLLSLRTSGALHSSCARRPSLHMLTYGASKFKSSPIKRAAASAAALISLVYYIYNTVNRRRQRSKPRGSPRDNSHQLAN